MKTKLNFLSVKAKNFRSIGNMGQELFYNNSPTTLVGSLENGAGKSTLLVHALYYALFDAAYLKSDKKSSLINSRSGKDTEVEVNFETKGSSWKVVRGMKPSVFDIFKDGVRVEDEAAVKDYQKYLEGILGMDEKVFCNTVALGKDKFVPFITMTAGEKRNYGEQMLDLVVFTRMNEITKEDLKAIKREYDEVTYRQNNVETKITAQKRLIGVIESQIAKRSGEVDDQINLIYPKITESEDMITKLQEKKQGHTAEFLDVSAKFADLSRYESALTNASSKIRSLNEVVKRFETMDTCPTCSQELSSIVKDGLTSDSKEQITKLNEGMSLLNKNIDERKEFAKEAAEVRTKINALDVGINGLQERIRGFKGQIASLNSLKGSGEEEVQLVAAQKELEALEFQFDVFKKESTQLQLNITNHSGLLFALKDDSVKAEIAKLYMPFLNGQINKYMDALNLWINVKLDEEFSVEMFAPERKGQTIASLSTGQACRVNLSILLAWRDIARMKASVDCNILVLDEILENLSEQGSKDFMEMWRALNPDSDVKLFVITQRVTEFEELFDDTIMYALKDDMTVRIK